MKSLRQFGAILLLLAACVAPAVACMAADGRMTVEEQACCRAMKSQCGQMEMPASHDCCKRARAGVRDSALKAETAALHPTIAVALWVSIFVLRSPHDAVNGWLQRPEHSPPKSPPSPVSILRI